MKIILTAFGGKLQSSAMDWPERTAPRVEMIMDMGLKAPWESGEGKPTATKSNLKRGVFEWTGKSKWGNNARDESYEIREYKLIDVI